MDGSLTVTNDVKFSFVAADGSERSLNVRAECRRVHAVAAHLRERIRPNGVVGLLFRSEPNLVINWLAALAAGLRPLVLQYPTRKQNRTYWFDSVRHTLAVANLAGLVADNYCGSLGLSDILEPVLQSELDHLALGEDGPILPNDFAIIQLSSGTTGYRKAMQFASADLRRHVADYNAVLGLTGSDRIVSWLQLYHDMGYVACFVMPMLLGIDVIMIDPMDWVSKPRLLLEAVQWHHATVCYMPNFGFEVMARELVGTAPGSMSSMRRWISCSEPVSATTARKFMEVTGAAPDTFSPCYAMAENIFAVSLGTGCRTLALNGTDAVSCGFAIPGVDVKIADGEIWIRSPTSLAGYLDGQDIRDAEGFYPTGDLGTVVDGEIYLSGRKQDLLIQAGRKFMLSDIDLRLNQLRPDVQGRAATLALRDEQLGTETPTVLIEAQDFFQRTDGPEIAAALKGAAGLDRVEVAFVPPRFLTKTSSGKINRGKSRADWLAVVAAQAGRGAAVRDPVSELRANFSTSKWDVCVSEVLDSLSLTLLRIVLESTPIRYDKTWSLNEYAAALGATAATVAQPAADGIRIVSLADYNSIRRFSERHLDRLCEAFGCPVTLEHVCLPPSPILLSDLVFHDYFQPRLDQGPFAAIDRAMGKLKGASFLIFDDKAEFIFLSDATYPVLSHNFERDPTTDLISYRWPEYVQYHDKLPVAAVAGRDIPLQASSSTTRGLGRYLGVPIFRIARFKSLARFTSDWEYRVAPDEGVCASVNPDRLVDAMISWARNSGGPIPRRPIATHNRISHSDMAHLCANKVQQQSVDKILDHFDSFVLVGQSSSLPYVRQELDRRGKRYTRVSSHAANVLKSLPEKYDCLLICGTDGMVETEMAVVALQPITAQQPRIMNAGFLDLSPDALLDTKANSRTDWYCDFPLATGKDLPIIMDARMEQGREYHIKTAQGLLPTRGATGPAQMRRAAGLSGMVKDVVDQLDKTRDQEERRALLRSMRQAIVELRTAVLRAAPPPTAAATKEMQH